jgi:hypothetical protein
MKKDITNISEAYGKVFESGIGEPPEHKQKMQSVATELAAIAYRVKALKVRKDDGDRIMELAKEIESEYNAVR